MAAQLNTRKVFLSALIAFAMAAGAFFALAPAAEAVKSDCPYGKVCLWDGSTFGGQQSFWNGTDLGCHALENIDPRSGYNNTASKLAHLPAGAGAATFTILLYPGEDFKELSHQHTGSLCISTWY